MSNRVVLIIILCILAFGLVTIGLRRLKHKKSIVFKVITVITYPLLLYAIIGFLVGVKGLTNIYWAVPAAAIISVLSFNMVAKMLEKPLHEMKNTVDSLSEGNVNVTFTEKFQKGEHELAQVLRQLAKMTGSFKTIAEFATRVGKGELNAEYKLLGENDILGSSLLEMRQGLQNSAKEQLEHAKESEEKRNWGNSGLAKFAEILRNNNDNLEDLSYNIISNMVKYLGANQGGIFVLNDAENEQDKVLEMKACYAFNRKKFVQKQIYPGEGLVGTCYLEGETIYMTELPNSYITITSGLGEANPRAILICPLKVNDEVYGVIELASFHEFEPYQREFVQKVSESIAATISTVKVNIRTSQLLHQTKLQAEEMANQEEELRQNMEEMQATQEEMFRREAELKETLEQMNEVRKAAEEEEHEMRQFYDAILESNNMVELSADGVVTSVNQNLLNLFNVDKSVFIGKHVSAVIGEEAASAAWASLVQGRYYEDVQTPDAGSGKKITVRQKFMPIRNMQGKLLRVLLLVFPESK